MVRTFRVVATALDLDHQGQSKTGQELDLEQEDCVSETDL